MEESTYLVRATWDAEAHVWVAESDDVAGLVAEAADVEDLAVQIRTLVPELLEANGCLPNSSEVLVKLVAEYEHEERIILRAA
ncbi:MAG: DUF1902 domain-containing protein [Candidatus Binataceae bacterium]